MSRLGKAVLRALSKSSEDEGDQDPPSEPSDGLGLVQERIPGVPVMIRGCSVLDYGCGQGAQAVEMAKMGADRVVGVDINESLLEQARKKAYDLDVGDRVEFTSSFTDDLHGRFDLVFSRNAMEHYTRPRRVLDDIATALQSDGRAIIVFGPPWWHPYGAHMHYFTAVPWPHVWFSEKTIMEVRTDYRDDGAQQFEEVTGGLNRMSVKKFESLVEQSDLEFEFLRTRGIRGWDLLTYVPILRECLTSSVHAVLRASKS